MPFCSTLCFYCGCNKIVTRDKSKGVEYLKYLNEEIALQVERDSATTRGSRRCTGAAARRTFFSLEQVGQLMRRAARHFDFDRAAASIRSRSTRARCDAAYIAGLREAGFNRISIGVQDFDPGGAARGAPHPERGADAAK